MLSSEVKELIIMRWGGGWGGFSKMGQVAAKAIGAIPSLVIYPIVPFLILVVFLIYWVTALLYLTSAGSVTRNNCNNSCAAYDLTSLSISDNNCCGYSLHHSKNIAWAITYHVFGVFWTTQFINACCLTTIAGAIAAYYWARGKTSVSFCSTL
jgi:choline transporter-like protein 2/4/5